MGRVGWVPVRRALVALTLALLGLAATAGGPLAASTGVAPLGTDSNPVVCDDSVAIPGGIVVDGWQPTSRTPRYGFLPDEVVTLSSALDGAAIQVGLMRPDVPEGTRVPVVVLATPYAQGLGKVDLRDCAARLAYNLVPQGYAVAIVAARGTADSGGCMDLMGPKEQADLDQAVTWLGTRPWSNGNVGMTGLSYEGSTPWEVAALGNPHLKTVVPIEGVPDFFSLLFHDGAPEARALLFTNAFYDAFGAASPYPPGGRSLDRTLTNPRCPEWAEGLAASAESFRTGLRDAGGFWAARDHRPGVLANYTGSVLLVQGLQDWNVDPHVAFPWAAQLRDAGIEVKLLLPQGYHAYPDSLVGFDDSARADWPDLLLDWLDRWLLEDASIDTGPAVQVQDSLHAWRNESAWPPADAAPLALRLCPGGILSEAPCAGAARALVGPDPFHPGGYLDQYGADQFTEGFPDACATCASFAAPPRDATLRFAGAPVLDLTVTPTGRTGHVAAFLYVEADGVARRVGWGQADLRFAAGDGASHPVTPGEPMRVRLTLEPLDVAVPPGATLRVLLSQGASSDHVPSAPPVPVWLECGTLTLDAFERDAGDFFTP